MFRIYSQGFMTTEAPCQHSPHCLAHLAALSSHGMFAFHVFCFCCSVNQCVVSFCVAPVPGLSRFDLVQQLYVDFSVHLPDILFFFSSPTDGENVCNSQNGHPTKRRRTSVLDDSGRLSSPPGYLLYVTDSIDKMKKFLQTLHHIVSYGIIYNYQSAIE